MPEFGILLDDGRVVVGPGWLGPDEVIFSYHGFGGGRVYGQLVTRDPNNPEWRPADGHV